MFVWWVLGLYLSSFSVSQEFSQTWMELFQWLLKVNQNIFESHFETLDKQAWSSCWCFECAVRLAEAVCCAFIWTERGIGGWRAPWPLEKPVISPAILWLQLTPSRQKSKPLHLSSLLTLFYLFLAKCMKN